MDAEQKRGISEATYARFAIIFVCVLTLVWASSVGSLVRNHSLAYPIVCELYDANTGNDYDCSSIKCTEEIVRNGQCNICSDKLVESAGPGYSCHDERVTTDTQTPQQITEDPGLHGSILR